MRALKPKDLDILFRLRSNARESLTKLSRLTNIPVSTIYDRIKLYDGDLIKKNTAILDFSQLGFDTRATMCMSVDKAYKSELLAYLRKHQNVNSLYRINNGYDVMVEAIFRRLKDIEDFSDSLREKFKIKEVKTFFIIEELQKEEFMTRPEFMDMMKF